MNVLRIPVCVDLEGGVKIYLAHIDASAIPEQERTRLPNSVKKVSSVGTYA